MKLKASRPPSEYAEIDHWDDGVGWFAYPDEKMKRASHALRIHRTETEAGPADVWLVDPLRAPGIEEMLRDLGDVVGVVVLLDRHSRDSITFARRFDVPLYLPAWVDIDVPDDVRIVRFDDRLPGTEYELLETVDIPTWHEAALYDGETLVVADALGTANYFTTNEEAIGVHPFLRLIPPKTLRDLSPNRIFTGHGEGISIRASDEITDTLENSRRRTPGLWWTALKGLIGRSGDDEDSDENQE